MSNATLGTHCNRSMSLIRGSTVREIIWIVLGIHESLSRMDERERFGENSAW